MFWSAMSASAAADEGQVRVIFKCIFLWGRGGVGSSGFLFGHFSIGSVQSFAHINCLVFLNIFFRVSLTPESVDNHIRN